jgi:phage repressor protein C with HTH and peptisase S24 domain
MNGMDPVRQLILEKASERGTNLAQLSLKMGKNHSYLQQFIKRESPKVLKEDDRDALAPLLGVSASELKSGRIVTKNNATNGGTMLDSRHKEIEPPSQGGKEQQHAVLVPGAGLLGAADLPVYGTAQGGKGALVVTSEPVDWAMRPAPLLRVKDGYGVIVTGDSMAPEHREGSTALVNPHLPPRSGDTCVFRKHADDGTVLAVIKELRRATETTWYVRQHNPKRDFTLKRSDWQVCHVTVGNYKRR